MSPYSSIFIVSLHRLVLDFSVVDWSFSEGLHLCVIQSFFCFRKRSSRGRVRGRVGQFFGVWRARGYLNFPKQLIVFKENKQILHMMIIFHVMRGGQYMRRLTFGSLHKISRIEEDGHL